MYLVRVHSVNANMSSVSLSNIKELRNTLKKELQEQLQHLAKLKVTYFPQELKGMKTEVIEESIDRGNVSMFNVLSHFCTP